MLRNWVDYLMKAFLLLITIGILILTEGYAYGSVSSSPLGQLNSGISVQNIHCEKKFTLVIKIHNAFPACVKPNSISRLVKQGWILASYNNTSSKGLLTGYVTYYPCKPVERPTDLPCTGNAHSYTVSVYQIDNKTVVGQTKSGMNGIYQMELASGEYDVVTQTSLMSQKITKSNLVSIEANKTTVFNITIDSGIR